MIINERGLVRNIKQAYKRSGYTIISTGDQVTPVHGRLVRPGGLGQVPAQGPGGHRGVHGHAAGDVGRTGRHGRRRAAGGHAGGGGPGRGVLGDRRGQADTVTMVPVLFQGYQLYQVDGGGACYGVAAPLLSIVERDVAQHKEATRKGRAPAVLEP